MKVFFLKKKNNQEQSGHNTIRILISLPRRVLTVRTLRADNILECMYHVKGVAGARDGIVACQDGIVACPRWDCCMPEMGLWQA